MEPSSLGPRIPWFLLRAEFRDHQRLGVVLSPMLEAGERRSEGAPGVSGSAGCPVVAIGRGPVDVAASRVPGAYSAVSAVVGVRLEDADEDDVARAVGTHSLHDVLEGEAVVSRLAEPGSVVLGLVVECQHHRVVEGFELERRPIDRGISLTGGDR